LAEDRVLPKALSGLGVGIGVLLLASLACAAPIYVHVDSEGTAHFTDAPTKSYFRPLPAFGLPRGVNLTSGQYASLINDIATEQGVDPALVKAIIKAESNFNQRAISRKGAQGLMQLMPDTAFRYAVANAFDPAENIRGGVQYLRFLQELFPNQPHLTIAAYNAGENAILRHGGIPPYAETRAYVARVLRYYGQPEMASTAPTPSPILAPRRAPSRFSGAVYRQDQADGTPLFTDVPVTRAISR
jgi:hypothetical protein